MRRPALFIKIFKIKSTFFCDFIFSEDLFALHLLVIGQVVAYGSGAAAHTVDSVLEVVAVLVVTSDLDRFVVDDVAVDLLGAALAVLLYIHMGDAPALRLFSSLFLEGPVQASNSASLAALATLCGGLFFSMSVLAAKGATKVASSVVLCACCFSCGLMAAPLGPIDEIIAVYI